MVWPLCACVGPCGASAVAGGGVRAVRRGGDSGDCVCLVWSVLISHLILSAMRFGLCFLGGAAPPARVSADSQGRLTQIEPAATHGARAHN